MASFLMDFLLRRPNQSKSLGILPASFNPVTVAHLELARAALDHVEQTVLVLPRVLPHKEYEGASFEERLQILWTVVAAEPGLSLAISQGGLFAEIAREVRHTLGPDLRLWFLCGRDAAERIATWDYGKRGAFDQMMRDFGLLVAPRNGEYRPSDAHANSVRTLKVGASCEAVSGTLVRDLISRGEPWEHLVPEAGHALVREFYASAGDPAPARTQRT